MPKFEMILQNTNNLPNEGVLKSINYTNSRDKKTIDLHNDPIKLNIDSTGKRIKTYKGICFINQQLNNMRQCASGYVAREKKIYFVNHIPNELKTEKVKRLITYFHTLKQTLLKASTLQRFQYNHTTLWNKHTNDVVKLIIPPVSLHDEIRTDGYGTKSQCGLYYN